MYCSKCGLEIDDKAEYCIGCGAKVKRASTAKNHDVNKPGFLIKATSLFIPVFGFGFYFGLKDEYPRDAKTCLVFALINIVLTALITFLFAILPIILHISYLY